MRRKHFVGSDIAIFNEMIFNFESKSVGIKGVDLILTRKEYELLVFFLINKDRVLTKESIAEHLWGDNIDMADSFAFIYTHLNNLRRKIKQAGGSDYIKTIYGMGYKFSEK